mmetsp:Transcript_20613/g.66102  ORF Transcript_20613/g.66102 Transcript_20613/m.66102 type:complete len:368 (-) Transcript_20613:396-1499(-)
MRAHEAAARAADLLAQHGACAHGRGRAKVSAVRVCERSDVGAVVRHRLLAAAEGRRQVLKVGCQLGGVGADAAPAIGCAVVRAAARSFVRAKVALRLVPQIALLPRESAPLVGAPRQRLCLGHVHRVPPHVGEQRQRERRVHGAVAARARHVLVAEHTLLPVRASGPGSAAVLQLAASVRPVVAVELGLGRSSHLRRDDLADFVPSLRGDTDHVRLATLSAIAREAIVGVLRRGEAERVRDLVDGNAQLRGALARVRVQVGRPKVGVPTDWALIAVTHAGQRPRDGARGGGPRGDVDDHVRVAPRAAQNALKLLAARVADVCGVAGGLRVEGHQQRAADRVHAQPLLEPRLGARQQHRLEILTLLGR